MKSLSSFRFILVLIAVMALSGKANAAFHLWTISQIFSNADGTVQYIELTTSSGGQQFLRGHEISATQNGVVHSFVFPGDLPGDSANHKFLVATQGFQKLGVVTPDYVVPDGFLFLPNGTVNFAGVDSMAYVSLPSNGLDALDRSGKTVTNAPTNFAGASGQIVTVSSPSTLQANADGTVTDQRTGLTWMRCSMGQTWDGSTCTGTASTYTFDQANELTGTTTFAGQGDWRLPNIRELQTILDRSAYSPAIDKAAFPNTPNVNFFSGSSYAHDASFAWTVSFLDGYANYDHRSSSSAVRLVRGAESSGALTGITRPTGDYVDHGNGTVTHTPTNLMWKRCAEGQTWTGSTCSGTASGMTAAQLPLLGNSFAGQTDWRVPTEDELLSLVDYSKSLAPTLNLSAFPATPGSEFWSASPNVNSSGYVWSVSFSVGNADMSNDPSSSFAVRLVRGGQSVVVVPVCTLTASPAVISAGASATLTASCTPAAASYTWTGGTCAGMASATCTVTPTGTTTYSVVGVNAGGTSQAASATVSVTASLATYTVPGTLGNDVFVLTAGNSYYGGGGNDTFIISPNTLRGDVTARIVDSEGDNLIQLVDGMTVTASTFYSDAAQLTLSTGARVQILGASKFKFQLGANALAGDTATVLTYSQFVTSLGTSLSGTLPASGTAGYVVPTGFTQASLPVPAVAANASTIPGTLGDDVLVPSGANNHLGGGGNDTYIISPYTLSGTVTAKIIDTEGSNVIQLVNGTTLASSSFFNNAVQLTLSNGATVQILGASGFGYQLGANAPAGETASSLGCDSK